MKKKEDLQDIEINLSVFIKFFINNGKILLAFMVISVILTQIIYKSQGKLLQVVNGTSLIRLSNTEVGEATSFDYIKMNVLRASIPGLIAIIIENNANLIESLKKDEFIGDFTNNRNFAGEHFKTENFEALAVLKDPRWIETNITGSNGRFTASKRNTVPVSLERLFGKDYIYKPYEDIVITSTGNNKKDVKAQLENAQTALGRALQYTSFRQWITNNINAIELEKFQISHTIERLSKTKNDNITKETNAIKFFNANNEVSLSFFINTLDKNSDKKLLVLTELDEHIANNLHLAREHFKTLNYEVLAVLNNPENGEPGNDTLMITKPESIPFPYSFSPFAQRHEYLLSVKKKIYALREAIELNRLKKAESEERLELIQIEEDLYTKYSSNFDKNFTKLAPSNINELIDYVQQKLKITSVKEAATRELLASHIQELKSFQLMPRIFSQVPIISYTSFHEGYFKRIILGSSVGLFFALTFISIRSLFRKKRII